LYCFKADVDVKQLFFIAGVDIRLVGEGLWMYEGWIKEYVGGDRF